MNNSEDKLPPPLGVYWIDEEDYAALQTILEDGSTLPPTWREWHQMAEEMERGLKAYGHPVMRVRIDPRIFPIWCSAHDTNTGREGRKRFVANAVSERYGEQT
jgi:hypothetical protein